VLTDQGMGQQGFLDEDAIALDGGLNGQVLVRLDGLDQASDLRRERLERKRVGAIPVDTRWDLDGRIVRKIWQRSAVPDIDHLDVARPGVE
jgi:hypothetical protein